MTSAGRISATNGALLEVTLEDVATRKCIVTKDAHVWAITGVSQHVTLQMFCVKVGLGAVWARKFAISILLRDLTAFWRAVETVGRYGRPTRSTGQNAASPLRTDNMGTRRVASNLRSHARDALWTGPARVAVVAVGRIKRRPRRSRSQGWLVILTRLL